MRLLFLDIDGVLNDHTAYANGYCKIREDLVEHLNAILLACPDVQIVLSSAWRYTVNTVSAIETLLAVHGCNCSRRIHGMTEPDEVTHCGPMPDFGDREAWTRIGLKLRATQIQRYVFDHAPHRWVVIDDLPLKLDECLVQTDPKVGLTRAQAMRAVEILETNVTG